MKKVLNKAFTMVELLIVIGIIGLLAVTLLLALNPAEAMKKTRDAKRLKDATVLQSIFEQGIADNVVFLPACVGAVCNSSTANTAANSQGQNCSAANWLAAQNVLCRYAKVIPVDPLNARTSSCMNTAAGAPVAGCTMQYYASIVGGDYEINVRQESQSNGQRVMGDAGNNPFMAEVYSNTSALIGAVQNP